MTAFNPTTLSDLHAWMDRHFRLVMGYPGPYIEYAIKRGDVVSMHREFYWAIAAATCLKNEEAEEALVEWMIDTMEMSRRAICKICEKPENYRPTMFVRMMPEIERTRVDTMVRGRIAVPGFSFEEFSATVEKPFHRLEGPEYVG